MGWLMCLCSLLFFLLQFQVNYSSSFSSNSSFTQPCRHDQSLALLQFKNLFFFDPYASSFQCDKSYPKMVSWKKGSDCCSWDGVTCDRVTANVIGLDLSCSWLHGTIHPNSSLFLLPHLQWLNLDGNNFDGSRISSQFCRFASLMHLNLSYSAFSGHVPLEISHLSKLVSLDLSWNWAKLETPSLKRLVQNLTELRELSLHGVNMSSVELGSLMNLSSSLTSLNLEFCELQGKFSDHIFHHSNLQMLKLGRNYDLTVHFPKGNWSSPLEILDLSSTSLSGELAGSIDNLKSLNYLDLSSTKFSGKVLESIDNLKSLNYLDLSSTKFSGKVLESIDNLKSLNYLDLYSTKFSGNGLKSIGNLKSLNYLDLSSTNFSGKLPDSIGNLKSLNHLDLSFTNFSGELPYSIGNLQSLNYLNLRYCEFSGPIPASLGNLTQITYLDLYSNQFIGEIPSSLSNLRQLPHLDLSWNNFNRFSFSIVNMTQLVSIQLSNNQLMGPIPSQDPVHNQLASPIPSPLLPNLKSLDLSYNLLNGTIPYWVFTLPSLAHLDLSHNQLTGQIHEFQYNTLEFVILNNNELHGPIPTSIFQLINLTSLKLSSNKLSVIVEVDKFTKLKSLRFLELSGNSLSWTTNNNVNFTLPALSILKLSSCNLTEFPNFLRNLENLGALDFSNNKIHGEIPNWVLGIGKDSLSYLNLSSNFLTRIEKLPWNNLLFLDLHSNMLQGPLPLPPFSMLVFSISNNKLTGKIPSLICNASVLQILDLSNNSLSGTIPECLGNFSSDLSVLDLRMNSFHGSIPGTFAEGNRLRNLDFNGNQLEGAVPRSLINCRNLEVLDLGKNEIHDTFPNWLDTLPELKVLVLQSNRFHGPIGNSKTQFPFPRLRIIDFSHNRFTGLLPAKYFKSLKAVMNVDEENTQQRYMGEEYYQDSVMVTMKGLDYELVKILTIFTTIDLSNNQFQGEIPTLIGNLNSLRVLNLSHNSLTGQIPSSLGNLTLLESLDLSSNKLNGVIPLQLTDLTFLEVLNLSHNHMEGPIPQGKQFDTFENNSYAENSGLCGLPLSKKCGGDEEPQPPPSPSIQKEDDSEFGGGFGWKSVMMGFGPGMVIGLGIGYHMFLNGEPLWFARIVEGVRHRKVKRSNRTAQRRGAGGRGN